MSSGLAAVAWVMTVDRHAVPEIAKSLKGVAGRMPGNRRPAPAARVAAGCPARRGARQLIRLGTGLAGFWLAGCVMLPLPPMGPQLHQAEVLALIEGGADRATLQGLLGEPTGTYLDGRLEVFRGGSERANLGILMVGPGGGGGVGVAPIMPEELFVFAELDPEGRTLGTLLWAVHPTGRALSEQGVGGAGTLAPLAHPPATAQLREVVRWKPKRSPMQRAWHGSIYRLATVRNGAPVLSPDGGRVAVRDGERIVVRDLATGGAVGSFPIDSSPCGGLELSPAVRSMWFPALAFAEEEVLVLIGASGRVCRWEVASGEPPRPTGAGVVWRAYDSLGVPLAGPLPLAEGHVVVGGDDGVLRPWAPATAESPAVAAAERGIGDCWPPVAGGAGRHLLQSCLRFAANRLTRLLLVRDAQTLEPLASWSIEAATTTLDGRAFDPTATGLAAAGATSGLVALANGFIVLVWTDATMALGQAAPELHEPTIVLSSALGGVASSDSGRPLPPLLAFSRDGGRLIVGHFGCVVLDTATWGEVWRCETDYGSMGSELMEGLAMTPDGRHIVTHEALYALP